MPIYNNCFKCKSTKTSNKKTYHQNPQTINAEESVERRKPPTLLVGT